MRFEIGFAGIPRDFIDFVYRNRESFCGHGVTYVAETLKPTAGYYRNTHASYFIKHFERRLAEDHENALADTAFAIVYVSTHAEAHEFAEALFPALMTIPVEWNPSGHNLTTRGRSARELTGLLRVAVDKIRKSIPVLKKELTEQDNRTPWLLPKRNFKSEALVPKLIEIQRRIGSGEAAPDVLSQLKRDFVSEHPFQRVDGNRRACFVDRKGVEFHAPGKDRHGFARPGPERHPPMCLVAGRRRLGAPYDRAFHYDCARGGGKLIGQFASCHAEPTRIEGDPHLNIAPNDFVRR